jgi:hypothetical protein
LIQTYSNLFELPILIFQTITQPVYQLGPVMDFAAHVLPFDPRFVSNKVVAFPANDLVIADLPFGFVHGGAGYL